MTQYTSKEGDTADLIAWKLYERQDSRVVEQLLDANPGLADLGPLLPAGLVINIPEITVEQAANDAVKLWD